MTRLTRPASADPGRALRNIGYEERFARLERAIALAGASGGGDGDISLPAGDLDFAARVVTISGRAVTAIVFDTDPRLTDAREPDGAAGGKLSGSYPNPGLAVGGVGSTELADDAVTASKIAATLDEVPRAVANLDLNTHRLTNIGAASASTDAIRSDDPRLISPRKTLVEAGGSLTPGQAATYMLRRDGGGLLLTTAAITGNVHVFPLDAASYRGIGGAVPQIRIVAWVVTGNTAPAATYTFSLQSFTLSGFIGTFTPVVGVENAVVTAPPANDLTPAYGAAFDMPAATGDGFAITMSASAAGAVGSNPLFGARLEIIK